VTVSRLDDAQGVCSLPRSPGAGDKSVRAERRERGVGQIPYKLNWLEALTAWIKQELAAHPRLVVLAISISHQKHAMCTIRSSGKGACSSASQNAPPFATAGCRLCDTFRLFDQPRSFSAGGITVCRASGATTGCASITSWRDDALCKACSVCRIDKGPRANERPLIMPGVADSD